MSERPTAGNKTVLTVVQSEGAQGVHVHLRRDFRFVSPPAPAPSPVRLQTVGSLIQPGTPKDGPDEGEEALPTDGENALGRMEKGKEKAIKDDGEIIQPVLEGSPADQFEEEKANDKYAYQVQPESEVVSNDGGETIARAGDELDVDTEEPAFQGQGKAPKEYGNDTQPEAVGASGERRSESLYGEG